MRRTYVLFGSCRITHSKIKEKDTIIADHQRSGCFKPEPEPQQCYPPARPLTWCRLDRRKVSTSLRCSSTSWAKRRRFFSSRVFSFTSRRRASASERASPTCHAHRQARGHQCEFFISAAGELVSEDVPEQITNSLESRILKIQKRSIRSCTTSECCSPYPKHTCS